MERSGDRLCVFSRSLRRLGFTVGLLYFMFLVTDAHGCPDTCRCQNRSMTCVDSPALVLPLELSRRTQNLTLKGNNISTLIERAFWGNGTDLDLRALSLQDNNIQAIESCAFCETTRLHFLDLSYNRLMFVSPDAFRGLGELRSLYLRDAVTPSGARLLADALSAHALPHLQRLDLSGNRLKAMPLYGFGNFDLTTLILTNNSLETLDKVNVTEFIKFSKIRVYLSLNQFVCDCDLEPFHDWLKNSSQCADADLLTCLQSGEKRAARPEKLKNVSFLECSDQKLEAVSYVFLGIVMALIGVVFLMVLYLNRRGIKRWLNNIREACRDQMEVYHYRYEQDSDPRLANVAV